MSTWPQREVPSSVFVDVVATAYQRLEERATTERSTVSKQDRVRGYIVDQAPQIFQIADIRIALLGVSDQTIRLALDRLKSEGAIVSTGRGRTVAWIRRPG